jgi:hypothetical protein
MLASAAFALAGLLESAEGVVYGDICGEGPFVALERCIGEGPIIPGRRTFSKSGAGDCLKREVEAASSNMCRTFSGNGTGVCLGRRACARASSPAGSLVRSIDSIRLLCL